MPNKVTRTFVKIGRDLSQEERLELIRELMARLEWTQGELASAIGYSRKGMSLFVTGKRVVDLTCMLALSWLAVEQGLPYHFHPVVKLTRSRKVHRAP